MVGRFDGRLSDRVGRKPILIAGSVALVVLGLPSVLLLQSGFLGQFGGLLIMGLTLVCFSSVCPSTLPALFPTEIRYGGLSITVNLFVSAFAGTAATVIGGLILLAGDLNWPGYYLIGAGVVGLISCYFLVESAGKPLDGSKPAVATEEEAREADRGRAAGLTPAPLVCGPDHA